MAGDRDSCPCRPGRPFLPARATAPSRSSPARRRGRRASGWALTTARAATAGGRLPVADEPRGRRSLNASPCPRGVRTSVLWPASRRLEIRLNETDTRTDGFAVASEGCDGLALEPSADLRVWLVNEVPACRISLRRGSKEVRAQSIWIQTCPPRFFLR